MEIIIISCANFILVLEYEDIKIFRNVVTLRHRVLSRMAWILSSTAGRTSKLWHFSWLSLNFRITVVRRTSGRKLGALSKIDALSPRRINSLSPTPKFRVFHSYPTLSPASHHLLLLIHLRRPRWHYSPIRTLASLMDFSPSKLFLGLAF